MNRLAAAVVPASFPIAAAHEAADQADEGEVQVLGGVFLPLAVTASNPISPKTSNAPM